MSSACVVSTTRVLDVKNHNNSDNLDIIQVLGWQCVVKRDEFKINDPVIYFPPDTVISQKWIDYFGIEKFLKSGRIGKISLRGEPSFGFVTKNIFGLEDGNNVADFFEATKYDPPIRYNTGDIDRPNEFFFEYTDIENLRNFPDILIEGEEVIVTEKIDGTNSRIGKINGEIVVGSHRTIKKRPIEEEIKNNLYWLPYIHPGILNLLENTKDNIIIYGEIFGGTNSPMNYGIKPGKRQYTVFDININGKYLNYEDLERLCIRNTIALAPILYNGPYSLDKIKEVSSGKSNIGYTNIKEGSIIRPIKERTHPKVGRVIMKYKSDEYLLKNYQDFTDI